MASFGASCHVMHLSPTLAAAVQWCRATAIQSLVIHMRMRPPIEVLHFFWKTPCSEPDGQSLRYMMLELCIDLNTACQGYLDML